MRFIIKLKNLILLLFKPSLITSIYYNFKLLPFNQAIKLPLFIDWRTVIIAKPKTFEVRNPKRFSIAIGVKTPKARFVGSERVWIKNRGKITFDTSCSLQRGTNLYVCGDLSFAKNFNAGINLIINCAGTMSFGENCLLSRHINVRDNDGHSINGEIQVREVKVGNHVWLGENVALLKGAKIPDNSIVGFGTIVTKSFTEPNSVIIGNPAYVVKTGITWNTDIHPLMGD